MKNLSSLWSGSFVSIGSLESRKQKSVESRRHAILPPYHLCKQVELNLKIETQKNEKLIKWMTSYPCQNHVLVTHWVRLACIYEETSKLQFLMSSINILYEYEEENENIVEHQNWPITKIYRQQQAVLCNWSLSISEIHQYRKIARLPLTKKGKTTPIRTALVSPVHKSDTRISHMERSLYKSEL